MKHPQTRGRLSASYPEQIQFLCLYLTGIWTFLILIFDIKIYSLRLVYCLGMLGSCALFCLASLSQIHVGKIRFPSKLAIMMVVWFLISQLIQFTSGTIVHHYTHVLPVYLLAFPFASSTHDEERQKGLKILALIYISAVLVWVLYTVLLITDHVPLSMQTHVQWDGTRLRVFQHSNVCARGFMIGIAFSLGFSLKTPRKWVKSLLLVAAALMFVSLSLTNSRSSILITCSLIGGIVFFAVHKETWKQVAIGLMLALTITVTLFLTAHGLYQWNSQQLVNKWAAQASTSTNAGNISSEHPPVDVVSLSTRNVQTQNPPILSDLQTGDVLLMASENISVAPSVELPETISPQNSFITDLPTLNNRISIWICSLQRIQENPSILLWGTNTTELVIDGITVQHTHNSWLEALLRMGLPGLIFSLIFTWQALWCSAVLLCNRQVDIWKKIISMLVLCILLGSFLEPILFVSTLSWNFIDFLFFLCLGYMLQWKKRILAK